MALVYDANPGPYEGPNVDWTKINPHKPFETHLENYYTLKFFQQNGTREEKQQASAELAICERKLKFWERMPLFEKPIADAIRLKFKKQWG